MTLPAWARAAAIYADRRFAVLLLLGFSSGLPLALCLSTLTVRLAEGGIDKTSIGLFALVGLPYSLKFAWAPLIDRLPLPLLTRAFGRRRGWALLSQAALVLALLGLGASDPVTALWWTALFAVAVAFCSASQDIVIDAYRIEILDEKEYGAGAATLVLGYRFGMLTSGAGALYLASAVDWTAVYAVMAALVGVGMLTILLSREPAAPPAEPRQSWLYGAVVAPFGDFMKRPSWAMLLLFIVLYKLGDVFAGHMAAPFYLEIGFSKIDIANATKIVGLAATILGGLVGGVLVGRLGMLKSLFVCGVLQMASNLMFVALAEAGDSLGLLMLTVAGENVSAGMGTAAFVAFLSSLCSVQYTATQYALLSSFFAFGRDVMASATGWLADSTDWTGYFLIATAAAVPGLLVLLWLSGRTAAPVPEVKAAAGG